MPTETEPCNIVICGPNGRMGSAILKQAEADSKFNVTALLSHATPESNTDKVVRSLTGLESSTKAVIIDFTSPEATAEIANEAMQLGWPLLVGTTGLNDSHLAHLREVSQKIPVLQTYNTSLGVTLLARLVESAAAQLADYDIEIIETHHRLKKDSPSGTAILLANAAARGRSIKLEDNVIHGRQGLSPQRPPSEIGIHAVRGGDVAGDHMVLFAGIGERVELSHRATSRETFARGALHAARFLLNAEPGYYTMNDVLGI